MTIAVDFDGVLHRYSLGWHDGTCYDEPVEGAGEALRVLMERDAVFIHTARSPTLVVSWLWVCLQIPASANDECRECGGIGHVWTAATPAPTPVVCDDCEGTGWLKFWNERGQVLVTQRKLPAVAYIDDRAVRFTDWPQALAELDRLTGDHTCRRPEERQ